MTPALRHEWHQFRLLSRDSVRRLLDSVLVSRDADPMLFALWFLTLAVVPPTLVALRKVIQYAYMSNATPAFVEQIATADRTFFVLYGMLATALLAALTWDALFPDRIDQEIIGVLPVRPRTMAAARLSAAMTVGATFAAAVSLPAALIYSIASSTHPLLGSFPRVLAAHVTATIMACACTFLGLMALRAMVALCAGDRVADRLALVLQFFTVVLLVEVFLFLPAVLPDVVRAMQEGRASYAWMPPVWFAALFMWIAEGGGFLGAFAMRGIYVTAAAFVLVIVAGLLPAAWLGRRVLEVRKPHHASGLAVLSRAVVLLVVRGAAVRSMVNFGVSSLARSRRHAIVLATYLGLAIAVGVLRLLPPLLGRGTLVLSEPRSYIVALPLVLMFFAVFGLRASFAIPTELDANWVFRLTQPTVRDVVRVSRWLTLLVGVLPISIAWLLVSLTIWPVRAAVSTAVFSCIVGMLLTEIALGNWTKVPFASAHAPAAETLKSRWPWYIFALGFYVLVMTGLQMAALRSWTGTSAFIAGGLSLAIAVRLWRARTLRLRSPTFDVPQEAVTLNLSEALS
jgi:hypothetical protein